MRNVLRFRSVAIVLLALGLFAGSLANVGAQATPITGQSGSVVVSTFECTQIEEPTAIVSEPAKVQVAGEAPIDGCVPDDTVFQIFVNGDSDSEPFAEFNAGVETINGIPQNAPGVPHLLLEVDRNVFFEFFIESGGVTTATVLNPADDGNATPVGRDDDGGSSADGKDDGGAAAGGDDDDDSVNALPSTGQGTDSGTSGSSIVLLFGAMSLVALAAGFAWRQRRTA